MSVLAVAVDVEASLLTLARNQHVWPDGMLKLGPDLVRYAHIIKATNPEVVVETGTRTGGSARWFALQGVQVITVDISPVVAPHAQVVCVTGDSADPAVVARVAALVAGRRCMVSLDSDHSTAHVAAEIKLYGPLVSPGCHLVVEDGIFGYASDELRTQHGLGGMVGSPLEAIAAQLDGNPDWLRDVAVEQLRDVSHHPAGFWVRRG